MKVAYDAAVAEQKAVQRKVLAYSRAKAMARAKANRGGA